MTDVEPGIGGHAVRDAALRVLSRVEHGRRSDRSLDHVLARHKLDARDRALCTEIVYGTLRRQRTLDRTLAPYCKRRLDALDVPVRVALRMAAYQSACLGSVPPHAAVHRSVEALKRMLPRATGLANAVLRAWLRAGGRLDAGDGSLGQRFDLPDWLAERWRERLQHGGEDWLAATMQPPRAYLRASPARATSEEVVARLAAAGGHAEIGARAPGSVRVLDADRKAIGKLIEDGAAMPRSEAAQIVTGFLDSDATPVLDACSGRGGKARQLAERGGLVIAIDNHGQRLAASRVLAGRTAAGRLAWVHADLVVSGMPLRRRLARILVDVPCSGLGTIRRHPEIKWHTTPADLQRHAKTQHAILRTCLRYLEAGGQLLYVTCSTEPEENERLVDAVLAAEPGIVRSPLTGVPHGCLVDELGDVRTYPADPELDGFYVARLTRSTG